MSVPLSLTDNYPTFAPDAEVGFKLSKPGYNAERTAASNLIFSSSWPSLQIAYETTVTSTVGSSGSTTITHNLGYPCFCVVTAYGPDNGGIGSVTMRFIPNVTATTATITTSYFTNQNNFLNNATKLNFKCYRLDLTKDIDYALAPGDTFKQPYDRDFGIKVVKPNKQITSTDLRDYVLHSRAQSPLILAVKTQATMAPANAGVGGLTGLVQYTSRQKSPVWVYGFVQTAANTFQFAPFYTQSYPRTFTDGYISYVGWNNYTVGLGGATLVITRDPMFSPTQTTVQY